MLTFWGDIEETDISAYAATLILPAYMSHLQLSPFRFTDQTRGSTGEQPLTLTYTGPGRLEQYELSARDHALDLLCRTCPGLSREGIELPQQGAIWSWPPISGKKASQDTPVVITRDDHTADAQEEAAVTMRLFFRPVVATLGVISPGGFPPENAYLSVSRKEIFMHINVITEYFLAWLDRLGTPEESENLRCRATACGFCVTTPYLTIEATIAPNEVFQDMLRFAGLSRWFDELGDTIAPDLDAPETNIADNGLLVKLKTKNE